MKVTEAAALDAQKIMQDPDATSEELAAADEVLMAYADRRHVYNHEFVVLRLTQYIQRRQKQSRYGK